MIARLLVLAWGVSGAAVAAAGGAWLDTSPPVAWASAGAPVPAAPPPPADARSLADGRCAGQARTPHGKEDAAVRAAGWTLVGPLQIFDDVTLVTAAVAADGMCRWLGEQVFAFVGGRFAGTLSPAPMDARTDGSLDDVRLFGGRKLLARFRRYGQEDPLCCPSRTTTVSYEVRQAPKGPVLAPIAATTETAATAPGR